MAEHIKALRKKNGATYDAPIPLGADAKYVDLENNKTVQAVIGDYQKISPIAEIIEKHFYGSMNLWNSLTLEEKIDYDVVDILNEYTIHYENNGGSGSIPDGKKLQNNDYTIADGSSLTHSNTVGDEYIENNGYRYKDIYSHSFDKWNTETDGSGINYNPDSIYNDNKNLTLYAQWTNIDTGVMDPNSEQYYLTVNKDEGIESCTDSQWVDKGNSINIEATPKQYYEIINGLGSSGVMNSAKTVNVTSILGLKFSSDSNFTLSVANPGWLNVDNPGYIEYTIDNGDHWIEWDGSQLSGTANQPIYLRGRNNNIITGNNNSYKWTFTGKYCTGNIETLLDYQTVANGQPPTMEDYCYYYMFRSCTSLITVPELPAKELTEWCYSYMFLDCTSLTTAPQLPATTLEDYCYREMFKGCTSLTTAPELPATTLADYCYQNMFYGCTSLTTAPTLSATTLANNCYNGMFNRCVSLTTPPQLPATTLANNCYGNMFQNCISLTTSPELPVTTLVIGCYAGMFEGCKALTTIPQLPATTLTSSCYGNMFKSCTSIKLSTSSDSTTYKYAYRIPTSGTGTTASSALVGMFDYTGGTFTGTPDINTTYYTDHEPV